MLEAESVEEEELEKDQKPIKLGNFPTIVSKFFLRLYKDLEKVQKFNLKLNKQQRLQDARMAKLKTEHLNQLETMRLKHAISYNELQQSNQLIYHKNHLFMSGQKPADNRVLVIPTQDIS